MDAGFAGQKRHTPLYILRTDVMAAHRDRLGGLSVGKGRHPVPGRRTWIRRWHVRCFGTPLVDRAGLSAPVEQPTQRLPELLDRDGGGPGPAGLDAPRRQAA
jgi:hypothetical protein